MYLVTIAWLYVALLMALAEGFSASGTWLGAGVTFVLYGLLPVTLLLYIFGTPARRRRLRVEAAHSAGVSPDTGRSAEAASPPGPPTGSAAP